MICFRLFPFACLTFVRTLRFEARSKFRSLIGVVCVIVARAIFICCCCCQFHFYPARCRCRSRCLCLLLCCSNVCFATPVHFCITFTLTRYFAMLLYTFPTPFCVTLLNGSLTQNKRKTFNATFLAALLSARSPENLR